MTVSLAAITVDCEDALTVARFWSGALGRPLDRNPSTDFASIGMVGRRDTNGWRLGNDPTWLFAKVPEDKFREPRTGFLFPAVARLLGHFSASPGHLDEVGDARPVEPSDEDPR